ncbi:MAG: thiamine pyrophosphate-binding protein [bacterium]|nr:thiamine pyrophosphate-binding protein [bacterium]
MNKKLSKLSDFVFNFIESIGVKHVFMLPGGGCMHLVDSLGKNRKLKFIANLHEQASAIAADAYSQYTSNIGVVLVTTGPGGTNAITGVVASWIDSVPVLIISGQVKRADLLVGKGVRQMGPQEVDIVSLIKPITKYAVTVMKPDEIKFHLEKAFYLAKEGRPGPVWIDIPLDVQGAIIDENKLKTFDKPKQSIEEKDLNDKIYQLIKLINKSSRPIILAGNGIRLTNGVEKFREIISKINIPILTTWRALDILPEDNDLYIGRPGSIGQRGANFAQQNADLIICIGARLDVGQIAFSYNNFARGAKKVIVDIDKNEINKITTKIDIAFNMDAGIFLNSLIKQSNKIKIDTSKWLKRCQNWKKKYPVVLSEYMEHPSTSGGAAKKEKGYVNTYALIEILSKLLTNNDVIIPGSSGSCSEITLQAFKVKKGQRVFNSPGLGAMGFGLPASIGACIASGKKRTICLIGDGGLQHNIQELELLKRYQLPIKLFVLNNNAYASIRTTQNRYFNGNLVACDPSSGLTLPDTIKIANAYGLKTFKINNQDKMEEKINTMLNYDGPVICEVIVNPDFLTQPKISSEIKSDGKIVSKPMEDLWPFLNRKEFKANMIKK